MSANAIRLVRDLSGNSPIARSVRGHLKAKRWPQPSSSLQKKPSCRTLETDARDKGSDSPTIGWMAGAQAVVGGNVELGVAINLSNPKVPGLGAERTQPRHGPRIHY